MSVDTIITLNNDKEYALLERLELDGSIYFFAGGIDGNEETTGEYIFLEEINKDGKTFVKIVEDEELINKLTAITTKEYLEATESLED